MQVSKIDTPKFYKNDLPIDDKASGKSQSSTSYGLEQDSSSVDSGSQDSAVNISIQARLVGQHDSSNTVSSTYQAIFSSRVQSPSEENTSPGAVLAEKLAQEDPSSEIATPSASPLIESDAIDSAPPLKSFVYGVLGLERPDEAKKNDDASYTSGQWLKAAVSIGTIIAIFA